MCVRANQRAYVRAYACACDHKEENSKLSYINKDIDEILHLLINLHEPTDHTGVEYWCHIIMESHI